MSGHDRLRPYGIALYAPPIFRLLRKAQRVVFSPFSRAPDRLLPERFGALGMPAECSLTTQIRRPPRGEVAVEYNCPLIWHAQPQTLKEPANIIYITINNFNINNKCAFRSSR
jgi:hypothetical protein